MRLVVFAVLAVMADPQGAKELRMTAALGGTAILPLNFPDFRADFELIWRRNSSTILKRKKQIFAVGQESSMMPDGSLKLTGLQLHDSGQYQAEVYNTDGNLLKESSVTLGVMEMVSQPTVTYSCGKPVVLTCNLEKRPGNVTFDWTLNNVTMKGEHKEQLAVDGKLASGDAFLCTARNEVSLRGSPSVTLTCGGPGPTNPSLTQKSIPAAPSGHDLPTLRLKPLLLSAVFCFLVTTYSSI